MADMTAQQAPASSNAPVSKRKCKNKKKIQQQQKNTLTLSGKRVSQLVNGHNAVALEINNIMQKLHICNGHDSSLEEEPTPEAADPRVLAKGKNKDVQMNGHVNKSASSNNNHLNSNNNNNINNNDISKAIRHINSNNNSSRSSSNSQGKSKNNNKLKSEPNCHTTLTATPAEIEAAAAEIEATAVAVAATVAATVNNTELEKIINNCQIRRSSINNITNITNKSQNTANTSQATTRDNTSTPVEATESTAAGIATTELTARRCTLEIDSLAQNTSTRSTQNDETPSTSAAAAAAAATAEAARSKEQQEDALARMPMSTATSLTMSMPAIDISAEQIYYSEYEDEHQMHDIMRLIQAELSEPYSIYTYRYFIYNWPKLCFLASHDNQYVGAIVCKLDMHMNVRRGYIAMLAVRKEYRKLKIGTTLVTKAIEAMLADNADEVVLETEMRNEPALRLYENLGFVRDKRLFRYYLNGVDALRLKLWFR